MRAFLCVSLALSLLLCLLAGWAWYDYDWFDYRFNGCQCEQRYVFPPPDPNEPGIPVQRCVGHPVYPKILPEAVVTWLINSKYSLPPVSPE